MGDAITMARNTNFRKSFESSATMLVTAGTQHLTDADFFGALDHYVRYQPV